MQTNHKRKIIFFLWALVLLGQGCELTENKSDLPMSWQGTNNQDASLLQQQLQEHENTRHELADLLNRNRLRHDLVHIITHSRYGLCYFIPYSPADKNSVEGSIYLPIGALIAENGEVHFDGSLGTPVCIDKRTINDEIPITEKYLYSIPFKKLQDDGTEVNPALLLYAELLDNKVIQIDPTEFPDDGFPETRSSNSLLRFVVDYSSRYIGNNGIMGLHPETLRAAFHRALFRKNFNNLNWDYVIQHKLYQKMLLTLPMDRITEHPATFISSLLQDVGDEMLKEGFSMSFSYTYVIEPSHPTGGGSSGRPGSGTGGSSSGSDSPTVPEKPIQDASKTMQTIQTNTDALFQLFRQPVDTTLGINTYTSFSSFLTAVRAAPRYEHATSLIDYDGKYFLTEVLHGTETHTPNTTYHSGMIAEIHNHPNSSPPSALDLLFTAEMTAEKSHYQGTYVYIYGKELSYYSINVYDKRNAANLKNVLDTEIDRETGWFKEGGICHNMINQHKNTYKNIPVIYE